jgi:hypothetical protein
VSSDSSDPDVRPEETSSESSRDAHTPLPADQTGEAKGEDPKGQVREAQVPEDQGPGCLPGLLAAGALLLMAMFVCCGVSTWYLYQQRGVLAARTLSGSVIPELEQGDLSPEDKREVIGQLQGVVEEIEQGRLEDWQASGIMERLYRLPLFEWGDLAAVEAMINARQSIDEETKQEAKLQFSRLRRAAELGEVTAVDFSRDVLEHVYQPAVEGSAERPKLERNPSDDDLRNVIAEAELAANRAKIPREMFEVNFAKMLAQEIEAGRQVGGL